MDWVRYQIIGENRVSVPTHTFKIILTRQKNRAGFEALAFVMPNRDDWPTETALPEYLKSIDWIEARSGYNFFPAGDNDPNIIELEKATPERLWEVSQECRDLK